MRILVYLMNFEVDSRWSDIFLLALYRDRIFISITLSLSEVSTHQPAHLFPKSLARTFTPFFFLEQSRTELLPSALPKPLPGPLPSFPSSLPLPALFPLPARALRYRQAQFQNRATINELKLELAPFSNTPHTSHQSSIPRTGRSSTSSSLDPHTRPAECLAGTALPSDTEPP